jgi:hypothetical protein
MLCCLPRASLPQAVVLMVMVYSTADIHVFQRLIDSVRKPQRQDKICLDEFVIFRP